MQLISHSIFTSEALIHAFYTSKVLMHAIYYLWSTDACYLLPLKHWCMHFFTSIALMHQFFTSEALLHPFFLPLKHWCMLFITSEALMHAFFTSKALMHPDFYDGVSLFCRVHFKKPDMLKSQPTDTMNSSTPNCGMWVLCMLLSLFLSCRILSKFQW